MLTQFKIERHFNKLHVRLYAEKKGRVTEASLIILYDRRIVFNDAIRPADVLSLATPDEAEAWLSEVVTEHGSRIETWEHRYRKELVHA